MSGQTGWVFDPAHDAAARRLREPISRHKCRL